MAEHSVPIILDEVKTDSDHADPADRGYYGLAYRTLTIAAVCAAVAFGLFLLVFAIQVVLLVFAAVLFAVLLRSLADRLGSLTGLGPGWSLTIVVLGLVILLALVGWLIAPRLGSQVNQMGDKLSHAGQSLRQEIGRYEWGRRLLEKSSGAGSLLSHAEDLWGGITGLFSASVSIVVGAIVIVFVGLFLAARPSRYVDGFVRLLPPRNRGRAREIMHAMYCRMGWWLVGRGISMLEISITTGIGLWLLGVPLALTLGLLTGLLNFVPTFGPLIAAVPTALVALTVSPMTAVYAVGLYTLAACFDGYVVTPLVQMRVSAVPPALLLVAQVLMGVLAGQFGLVVAAPMLVVTMVLVEKAYVEDVVGKAPNVPVAHSS